MRGVLTGGFFIRTAQGELACQAASKHNWPATAPLESGNPRLPAGRCPPSETRADKPAVWRCAISPQPVFARRSGTPAFPRLRDDYRGTLRFQTTRNAPDCGWLSNAAGRSLPGMT
jgi:hypothetical protein